MKRLLLLLALLATPASAQDIKPFVYALTIGTGSTSILQADPSRKQLLFHNPNDSVKVAVCPVGPSRQSGGTTVTAAINGAGCITILPYDRVLIGAVSSAAPGTPQSAMGSAWVGIAASPSSALTIFEWN